MYFLQSEREVGILLHDSLPSKPMTSAAFCGQNIMFILKETKSSFRISSFPHMNIFGGRATKTTNPCIIMLLTILKSFSMKQNNPEIIFYEVGRIPGEME